MYSYYLWLRELADFKIKLKLDKRKILLKRLFLKQFLNVFKVNNLLQMFRTLGSPPPLVSSRIIVMMDTS